MSQVAQSTIAQAVYADSNACNFVRVVSELEALLSRLRNRALRTRWDYEDVVIFDIAETRIVLGWSDDRHDGQPVCLLVSVGPLPSAAQDATDPAHEMLCNRLMDRVQQRYPAEAVLWRQLPVPIEADLVDALIDCLPPLSVATGATTKTPAAQVAALPVPMRTVANDRPDLPPLDADRLAQVRAALYPVADQSPKESTQMRLAAQALNATLIVVWTPMGAAVMTYSLLKGEKFGFSGRMMAVAGTLSVLIQTPLLQQMAAFAGV